nr:inactive ubiquitin carboxyl-terminal hydrolase 50 isoform X2 [Maylandia zebra]
MKAKALSVKECAWMSEDCHLVDIPREATQRDTLCLPNIFQKSKKVKPLTKTRPSPNCQVYYTARELLLEVLDREAIRELIRRAAGVKAGPNRQSHCQSREQSTDVSEEGYADAVTWFSVVLQSGLSLGENCNFGHDLNVKLDGWQGVLKRNSIQADLLSLTRLEDGEKLEVLSAFCGHITQRYQALHTPGPNLAVKKYRLSSQQEHYSVYLALLCDPSSGFICNMYLYCPEQLQRQSKKSVVEQVVRHLLRPFCNHRCVVQLDSSAWMEERLTHILSRLGFTIHFVPAVKRPPSSPPEGSMMSELIAHLQGWTGPALVPLSDPKGTGVDVFLPGLWVTLHVICINTFVLHTLQSQSSGKKVNLTQFTRTLASQLAMNSSTTVPVLPRLNSSSYQEKNVSNICKQRTNTNICGQVTVKGKHRCSSAVRLQNNWNRPGVCGSKCLVAEVFVRLLEEMWLGTNSSCAPVEARSVLCSIFPQFNNYSQQDAQELLLFLLNTLHDDLKKVAKDQMHCSIRQQRQEHNRYCTTESTIVSQLFEGQLSYITLCMHCDQQAYSTQTFTVLSLPIPAGILKCSIQDCLSLFFEQTVLTGGEQLLCSVCRMRRETAVITSLDKPPEILMLHLKRFGCKGKKQVKLTTNVAFPMKLDLTPFLSSSVHNVSDSSYHLYAVVNHTGHLNMGHYTALCHNASAQTWHLFDDSLVREVQDTLVQSPNAYMLLYSRKPFQKPKIQGL